MNTASMNPNSVSKSGRALIKQLEGLRLSVYKDAAGYATIGYGHKISSGEQFPKAIASEEADLIFERDLNAVADSVSRLVTVTVNQNQFDAVASFVFNIGSTAFAGSTLLRQLNDGDYASAADQFLRWNKADANGVFREVAGLTRRRRAERALFLSK